MMKIYAVILTAIAASMVGGSVYACGDSLYRVGKGVAYRVYTAPLPGSVLVYGDGENAELLAKELARSGHGVRLITNSEELQAEIGSGAYDVVIAAYSDESVVAPDMTSKSGGTDISSGCVDRRGKGAGGQGLPTGPAGTKSRDKALPQGDPSNTEASKLKAH